MHSLLVGYNFPCYKHLCTIKVPLEVKILMWLIIKGGLNTLDLLVHKGIGQGGDCILCGEAAEFIQHLTIECRYSKEIWKSLKAALCITSAPKDMMDVWVDWRRNCVR